MTIIILGICFVLIAQWSDAPLPIYVIGLGGLALWAVA